VQRVDRLQDHLQAPNRRDGQAPQSPGGHRRKEKLNSIGTEEIDRAAAGVTSG
jgi:hypothetical protein